MNNKLLKFREGVLTTVIESITPLISLVYKPVPWEHPIDTLRKLPVPTLGAQMAAYLDHKNFPLYKNYETHDVKHVLLGYEMDALGEIRLQFYSLGNGNHSIPVIGTILLGFILIPECWKHFLEDFQRGRSHLDITKLNYGAILFEDLQTVQKSLKKNH